MSKKCMGKWVYKDKLYILAKNPIGKKSISLPDFFQKIVKYDSLFLMSVRDGKILEDPLKIISSVKQSLVNGQIFGTSDHILSKLDSLLWETSKCSAIKEKVLSNVYSSLIEYAQAFFIKNGAPVPSPKSIPSRLKKDFSEKIDRKAGLYSEEIINFTKEYRRKGGVIEGKNLDELMRHLSLFKELLGEAK